MSTATQKRREEQQQVWDLSDLYQGLDDPALLADQQSLSAQAATFRAQYQPLLEGLLTQPQSLLQALNSYADIQALAHDLMTYATLCWSVATQDPATNQLKAQLTRLLSEVSTQVEFFRQALAQLSPEALANWAQDPEIKAYHAFLHKTCSFQPYLLSEPEERILQLTHTSRRQRWLDLYLQTTASWSFEVQGQTLTEDAAMDFVRKADPDLRLAGYQSVHSTYAQHQDLIAYIYNSLIQDHATDASLRGFDSTLAQQAHEQSLSAGQITHLLAEIEARQDLFQHYYVLIQRQLQLPQLRSCDLTAPLRSADWQVDWDTGRQHLLQALAPLGPEIVSKTEAFFSQRWIHAQALPGKSAGAFCAPTASQHPFVLMNWNDNYFSLTALAHELGHALHFSETVAQEHVLHLMPPLFLAETASTLNEYLLAEQLLSTSSDPATRRYFLGEFLQRFMNGLFRQSQITAFEVLAHEAGAQGSLSAEWFQATWLGLAQARHGEVIETLPDEAVGWSRIPHLFLMPFYCYNYTLSNLIVLALIYQYRQDRQTFLPRYRRFLSSGGGALPQDLLQMLDLDLNHPAFYSQAFGVLQDLIGQLEALIDPSPITPAHQKERGKA